MATNGTFGWGPTWADLDSYNLGRGTLSIVTYAGKQRLKASGTASVVTDWSQPVRLKTEDWIWVVFGVRYVTSGTGHNVVFGDNGSNGFVWRTLTQTDTTFKIQLGVASAASYTVKGTSSTVYTQDTDIIIRFGIHNPTKAVEVYINGASSPEFSYTAAAEGLPAFRPRNGLESSPVAFDLNASEDLYWWDAAARESDAESGRPGTSPTYSIHDPSADTAEDDGLPNGGAAGADDHDWWDDHPAPDGDTTYIVFDSAAERKRVSEFSTGAALTGNMAALSVTGFRRARPAAADKNADSWMRFKDDGGTVKEIAHASLPGDTYKTEGLHGGDPPAGTWDDYVNGSDVFNGSGSTKKLQMGVRTAEPNNVNIRITSKGIEVCALDNDAPPVGTQTIRKTVYY